LLVAVEQQVDATGHKPSRVGLVSEVDEPVMHDCEPKAG
jgi:hypothetical protein